MSIDSNNKYCLTSRHEIKFIYKCINKTEGRVSRVILRVGRGQKSVCTSIPSLIRNVIEPSEMIDVVQSGAVANKFVHCFHLFDRLEAIITQYHCEPNQLKRSLSIRWYKLEFDLYVRSGYKYQTLIIRPAHTLYRLLYNELLKHLSYWILLQLTSGN